MTRTNTHFGAVCNSRAVLLLTHMHTWQAGDKEAALLDAQAAVELAPHGFHNVGCDDEK